MWFFGIGRQFFNGVGADGNEIDPQYYHPRNYAKNLAEAAAATTSTVDDSGPGEVPILDVPYGGDDALMVDNLAGVPGGVDVESPGF